MADNPIRMAYLAGWRNVSDLCERLGDLEYAVGEGRVVPAPWEPFYKECPACRYATAYAWAQLQLQSPSEVAVALAFFLGEEEHLTTKIGRANWLILSAKNESSRITRRLMLTEALELWEEHDADWLENIMRTCAALGIETSVHFLRGRVRQALQPLTKEGPDEENAFPMPGAAAGQQSGFGFDKDLLQMDGWTPNPGLMVLPVDGKLHSLRREILLLDLGKVVLLRARKLVRSVTWDKVTLVHAMNGAVTLEIADETPLVVSGYNHPEQILQTVSACYRAATERILQAVAAKLTKATP